MMSVHRTEEWDSKFRICLSIIISVNVQKFELQGMHFLFHILFLADNFKKLPKWSFNTIFSFSSPPSSIKNILICQLLCMQQHAYNNN